MTQTAQAAADRWHELKTIMDASPSVDWRRAYQLITEIHPIRQTGQADWRMDNEMTDRGLRG